MSFTHFNNIKKNKYSISFNNDKYDYYIGLEYDEKHNNYQIKFISMNLRNSNAGYSYCYEMASKDSRQHDMIGSKSISYINDTMETYYCGSYPMHDYIYDVFGKNFIVFLKNNNIFVRNI
jgi:hypothetical protein